MHEGQSSALHRVSRKLFVLITIGILLAPLLASCSSPAVSQVQQIFGQGGGTLRLDGSEPTTLDPAKVVDDSSRPYLVQIFSGLVRLNSQLKVVPDLATHWVVSADGRTYTFDLRKDARFQDGRPLTAQDVKYSLDRACDPAVGSPLASLYLGDIVGANERLAGKATSVRGIVVKDSSTIQITIDSPKAYFLEKLTYPIADVVERQNVASGPNWAQHPIGSGPFRLASWVPSQQIVLVRNDNYYGVKPSVSAVTFYLGPDSPTALFEQGKLDVAPIPIGDYDRITDPANPLSKDVVVTPQLSLWYIAFNDQAKPFDDPKVRQAFAYATDKKRVVDGLANHTQTVARGILPPGLPGYNPSFQGIPFDLTRAKSLLAESSYHGAANLPPITLSVGANSGSVAAMLARMYEQNLGVKITVEEVRQGYYDDVRAGRVQIFVLGWIADYPDPQDFLDSLFYSTSAGNSSRYVNPAVDRLLLQARTEASTPARLALYQKAEQQIVADAPIIPVFDDTEFTLVRPTVQGLKLTPVGIISFRQVHLGTKTSLFTKR